MDGRDTYACQSNKLFSARSWMLLSFVLVEQSLLWSRELTASECRDVQAVFLVEGLTHFQSDGFETYSVIPLLEHF